MFGVANIGFLILGVHGFSLNPRGVSTETCSIQSGQAIGEISSPIHEASGLAVSRMNPGILYIHPDSGHGAHVFGISQSG